MDSKEPVLLHLHMSKNPDEVFSILCSNNTGLYSYHS